MIGVSIDETTTDEDVEILLDCFGAKLVTVSKDSLGTFSRKTPFMEHPIFNSCHTETEL